MRRLFKREIRCLHGWSRPLGGLSALQTELCILLRSEKVFDRPQWRHYHTVSFLVFNSWVFFKEMFLANTYLLTDWQKRMSTLAHLPVLTCSLRTSLAPQSGFTSQGELLPVVVLTCDSYQPAVDSVNNLVLSTLNSTFKRWSQTLLLFLDSLMCLAGSRNNIVLYCHLLGAPFWDDTLHPSEGFIPFPQIWFLLL